ncbi:NAD-P-binding protein [Bimuria novae-zelandiae CBS 107.79]|uniref:NAD-P-binding protein n=1 Tax=Bimuria novae-zelandiae CBS 107.79 TaxID=1447943 RepID=A0A6A5VI72_9PLEO|nr:NAD-P-binding protein [Bimuria novae-zelandiae CBS 107.79]
MSSNPKFKLSSSGVDFTKTTHHDTYDYIKPEQFNMKDHAVFITGASKGIGRATAISYAKAGASHIAVAARRDMADVEAELDRATKAAGKQPPVQEAAKKVEKAFGRLDILVNNAGYLEKTDPLHESQVDDWWRTWQVNVKRPYIVTRAFLPLLFNSKDSLKTILNVPSIAANSLHPGTSAYECGKLALLRFRESVNAEYADKDILSFGIHPDGIVTDLFRDMPDSLHAMLNDTPELAADSIVWMTAERRDWLKGRYISCNWDMQEFLGKRQAIEDGDLLKVRLDVGLS